MLVLSRKLGESLVIGGDVVVTVLRIGPNGVRLGVEAPEQMLVVRDELLENGDYVPPPPPIATHSSDR